MKTVGLYDDSEVLIKSLCILLILEVGLLQGEGRFSNFVGSQMYDASRSREARVHYPD